MTDDPIDPIARLLADPPDLPVAAGLAELVRAVTDRGTAVVLAPPGAGKTTLVPPALAAALPGRVVVTQPRRIAARAAARRLAALLGEPEGRTVGYAVRGEHVSSPATRVEVVTSGVLLRRLQRDPELPGVGAVVLDEVHERHLDADLCLALLVDVRAHLRDDLVLVAMSATVEAERTAAVLGGGAPSPLVEVAASLHPVTRVWCPPARGVLPLDERGVTPAFLDHVAATVRRALAERAGDVLVFVPGAGEVAGVVRRLADLGAGPAGDLRAAPGADRGDGGRDARVDVRPLHGRMPPHEQDLALTPGPRRRVVVSTSVAESSVTVPGVRVVVDAGLAREPRTDHRRGLAGLVTVRVSRSGATQRAGRAGREAPGAVLRCWSQADHARLDPHPRPEITTADLTAFALELAVWGSPDGADLALLDPPPPAAMLVARTTLQGLGAVDDRGAVTPRGRVVAGIAADPRLARALVDGAPLVGRRRAAEVVALLAEDVRAPGADLVAALRALRAGGPGAEAWERATAALLRALPESPDAADRGRHRRPDAGPGDDHAVGTVVALAHPDRIARLRRSGSTYLLTSGTGAALPPGSPLTGAAWLAVADADRGAGRRDATVRSAAPLDEDLALAAAPSLRREEERVEWVDGRVVARRTTALGAIELTSVPIARPRVELVAEAVRTGLDRDGLAALPWTPAATALRRRLAFLHAALGPPWPDVSDDALRAGLGQWLGPELGRVRGAGDLGRVDVLSGVRRLQPWPEAARLDELAPERVRVPSGSEVRVDYSGDQPVLAVRLQEVFGWRATPRLAGGRVPVLMHLLSPAGRPAAVTADLDSFWRAGYPQVRAELRGRYPKHAWPDDPTTAPPTRGVRRAADR